MSAVWDSLVKTLRGMRPSSRLEPEPTPIPLHDPAKPHILHFSLGPVQGFVSQARRTRDLWAGSFLLSWLAGHALRKVGDPARLRFPKVEDDRIWQGLADKPLHEKQTKPYAASLSNRFVAEVPGDFDPQDCASAIQEAWLRLAEEVWKTFIAPVAGSGNNTRAIWDEQIGKAGTPGPFWEVSWVLVPVEQDRDDLLDRRKLWRTWRDTRQHGDMCTLMGEWQEISGWSREHASPSSEAFWKAVRCQVATSMGRSGQQELVELRQQERLCAIALVKRLFALLDPGVLARVIGWPSPDIAPIGAIALTGRRIADSYRPSTAHLAAAHWIERAWHHAPGQCRALVVALEHIREAKALRVGERWAELGLHADEDFAALDGRLFFESAYEAQTELPKVLQGQTARVQELLKAIYKAPLPFRPNEPPETVGAPSPYYAILRMDGDEAGKLLRGNEGTLPTLLHAFAERVRTVIGKHHGELIFAGADDLLALLPLEDALPAALEVREAWAREVASTIEGATISAGLLYTHYEVALRWALEQARLLLDDTAKELNGRDSLAVGVFGRNGLMLEWASTWGVELGKDEVARALASLAERARTDAAGLASNRFAHGLNERLSGFFVGPVAERRELVGGGLAAPTVPEVQAKDLFRALGGLRAGAASEKDLADLLLLLEPRWRETKVDGTRAIEAAQEAPWQIDAPLLLRFLGTQWRPVDAEDAVARAA